MNSLSFLLMLISCYPIEPLIIGGKDIFWNELELLLIHILPRFSHIFYLMLAFPFFSHAHPHFRHALSCFAPYCQALATLCHALAMFCYDLLYIEEFSYVLPLLDMHGHAFTSLCLAELANLC